MGVSWSFVLQMEALGMLPSPGAALLDIGSSNLYNADAAGIAAFVRRHAADPGADLDAFAERMARGSRYDPVTGGANESFLGEVLERAGFRYEAIDIARGYRTRIVDLNHAALPQDMVGAFDAVINFGTTEHILNQMNSFVAIHDAAKPGGMIWHQLPAIGFLDHGYFTYTGRFFFDLAGYNRYDIVDMWFDGPGGPEDVFAAVRSYRSVFPALGQRLDRIGTAAREKALAATPIPTISINVVYRKVHDAPFTGPAETSTSVGEIPSSVVGAYRGAVAKTLAAVPAAQGLVAAAKSLLGRPGGRAAPRPEPPPAAPPPAAAPVVAAPAAIAPAAVSDAAVDPRIAALHPGLSREDVFRTLYGAIEYAIGAGVAGDVAEFGTMTGDSAEVLAKGLADFGERLAYADAAHGLPPRHLWLFDSFEGLPDTAGTPDADSPHVRAGVWAPGTCRGIDQAALARRVTRHLPEAHVRVVPGWFADTLPAIPAGTRFAVVHIDSDLYSSAKEVLDHLCATDALANGCMLLFDDWDCNAADPGHGERRAFAEAAERFGLRWSDAGRYGFVSRRIIVHR